MQLICLAESRSNAQLDSTPLIKNRNPVGKCVDNFLIPPFGTCRRTKGHVPTEELVLWRFFSLIFVQMEGGWRILRTDHPWLHVLRGILIVGANLTYFAALATLSLGEATALLEPDGVDAVDPMRRGILDGLCATAPGVIGAVLLLAPADDRGWVLRARRESRSPCSRIHSFGLWIWKFRTFN